MQRAKLALDVLTTWLSLACLRQVLGVISELLLLLMMMMMMMMMITMMVVIILKMKFLKRRLSREMEMRAG
jgi:hypothetical protein